MQRQRVNKQSSTRQFNKRAERTHPRNMRDAPARGGWRL